MSGLLDRSKSLAVQFYIPKQPLREFEVFSNTSTLASSKLPLLVLHRYFALRMIAQHLLESWKLRMIRTLKYFDVSDWTGDCTESGEKQWMFSESVKRHAHGMFLACPSGGLVAFSMATRKLYSNGGSRSLEAADRVSAHLSAHVAWSSKDWTR